MQQKNSFYITTPIYYVTAKPHLGSLYSTVIADVLARYNMQRNKDVFFLTGTDEHGQKIAESSAAAGKEPAVFVESFIPKYKEIWKLYNIDFTFFMRTTFDFHKKAVQQLLLQLLDQGDIYKSIYEGWYCVSCETFAAQKSESKEAVPCPTCARTTKLLSEESYFFKLSAYQDRLLQFYKNNSDFIIPKERSAEVIQFVKEGLKDLSISRTTVSWGVPFPNHPEHTVYVWIEALCNYITAIGYGQKEKQASFEKFWPADVHVIGKDIVRFHAVFWPALLFAAKVQPPKQLLVHGWITVNHQKMSKSFGNVVDPEELAKKYHVDTIRYFLLRYLPINQDGDFSYQELEKHITADLANDLGNLLQRLVTLYLKIDLKELHGDPVAGLISTQKHATLLMVADFENAMAQGQFHMALSIVWKYIHQLNSFFHSNEPWKHAKENKNFTAEILWVTSYGLYITALLLFPFMPEKMKNLLESLGINYNPKEQHIHEIIKGNWAQRFVLKQIPLLFEKYISEEKQEIKNTNTEKRAETRLEFVKTNNISFDTFASIELLVGTIIDCKEVQKSNKLLLLSVDFGLHGKRQIVSGIKEYFKPENLINQQAVFVYNLEPKNIFGYESHGMILLATDTKGIKSLIQPTMMVESGTQLK